MTANSAAEETLRELGVTDPKDIDIEAIAWCLGARVKFRPLDGCEARITGKGDEAIITVNSRGSWRRKRFSVAHELGHWKYHRGRILVCRSDEIGRSGQNYPTAERAADLYAAQLLMPPYIFDPIARTHPKLTFQTVSTLSDLFDTSVTATAIRLVEGRHSPAILVCHGPKGRKWFTRSPDVPDRWFPQDDLDAESFAFGVMFGNHPNDSMPRKIGADAWFDRADASRYEVLEQTFRTGDDEILTLVLIRDGAMLEEWNTRRPPVARRR
jgi:Zn-dependent peptidase ImmA (M78 family)